MSDLQSEIKVIRENPFRISRNIKKTHKSLGSQIKFSQKVQQIIRKLQKSDNQKIQYRLKLTSSSQTQSKEQRVEQEIGENQNQKQKQIEKNISESNQNNDCSFQEVHKDNFYQEYSTNEQDDMMDDQEYNFFHQNFDSLYKNVENDDTFILKLDDDNDFLKFFNN